MGNQYFWWASKIRNPGCPGTTTSLLDFRNPDMDSYFYFPGGALHLKKFMIPGAGFTKNLKSVQLT
jgi:hypothetical protein